MCCHIRDIFTEGILVHLTSKCDKDTRFFYEDSEEMY